MLKGEGMSSRIDFTFACETFVEVVAIIELSWVRFLEVFIVALWFSLTVTSPALIMFFMALFWLF